MGARDIRFMKTTEQRLIGEAYENGDPLKDIVERFGRSKAVIYRALRRLGIEPKRGKQ